jgi:hypothetical protein
LRDRVPAALAVIFLQQLAHQFKRRPFVPPSLDRHVEDLVALVSKVMRIGNAHHQGRRAIVARDDGLIGIEYSRSRFRKTDEQKTRHDRGKDHAADDFNHRHAWSWNRAGGTPLLTIGTGRQQSPGSASINLKPGYTRLVLEWTKWNNF